MPQVVEPRGKRSRLRSGVKATARAARVSRTTARMLRAWIGFDTARLSTLRFPLALTSSSLPREGSCRSASDLPRSRVRSTEQNASSVRQSAHTTSHRNVGLPPVAGFRNGLSRGFCQIGPLHVHVLECKSNPRHVFPRSPHRDREASVSVEHFAAPSCRKKLTAKALGLSTLLERLIEQIPINSPANAVASDPSAS
jgi:hypothetical protein